MVLEYGGKGGSGTGENKVDVEYGRNKVEVEYVGNTVEVEDGGT